MLLLFEIQSELRLKTKAVVRTRLVLLRSTCNPFGQKIPILCVPDCKLNFLLVFSAEFSEFAIYGLQSCRMCLAKTNENETLFSK